MFERHCPERRNAACLRLISFVTLKVGERRRISRPTWSLLRSKHRPLYPPSFILIFTFSFILPSPLPHPLSSPIPFLCSAYSLIASSLATTLLHSLVQTATCERDKHPISPSILASIQSTGRLATTLVLV